MTQRRRRSDRIANRIGVVGLLAVLLGLEFLGGLVTSHRAVMDARNEVRNQLAVGCDANQVQRVYDIVDERAGIQADRKIGTNRPTVAGYYLKMVNCGATYAVGNRSGKRIYLGDGDRDCFIHLVVVHYWAPTAVPTTNPRRLRAICRRT